MLDDQLEFIYNSSVWTQGCSLEDLINAIDNKDDWRGRAREIRANRYDDDDDVLCSG